MCTSQTRFHGADGAEVYDGCKGYIFTNWAMNANYLVWTHPQSGSIRFAVAMLLVFSIQFQRTAFRPLIKDLFCYIRSVIVPSLSYIAAMRLLSILSVRAVCVFITLLAAGGLLYLATTRKTSQIHIPGKEC